MSNRVCPDCGKALPAQTPAGLCPHCLLKLAERSVPNEEPPGAPSIQSPPGRFSSERPGDRIGRYKLLQEIGEGGMGTVWMAEQEEPVRRRVALKVVKLGMDTKQVIGRFEAERQALALMDHPNIAKVLDAGATDTGRPFFVMELVRGIPITKYCDKHRLDPEARLKLFIEVCRAVQHAHQKGIIHRDIKPSNILIANHDGEPVPKVIDFGIAKATDQKLTDKTVFTAFEQFMGTPAYMSPEQAEMNALDVDTRSDIYSLGVMLYELLTGKTPFDAQDLVAAGIEQMRKLIREREPVRPSTRISSLANAELTSVAQQRQSEPPKLIQCVRGDLDWIAMKCLEKDRTRRYQTANGLAMDLQRYLDNEPVVARPPSHAYRLRKFVSRNLITVTAAALATISLMLGLGVATHLLFKERQARQEANRARKGEEQQKLAFQAAAAEESRQRLRAEDQEKQAREQVYAATIALAHRAWEEGKIDTMLELLESQVPEPGREDLRGFEWFYLMGLTRSEAQVLSYGAQARCVAVSPDGTLVAAAGSIAPPRMSNAVRASPLATATNEMVILLWRVGDGTLVRSLAGHAGYVNALAFSPDGKRLVSGGYRNSVKVWDVETGREVANLIGLSNHVACVAFSPDGRFIGAGGANKGLGFGMNQLTRLIDSTRKEESIMVWNAESHEMVQTLKGHPGGVVAIAFSPDGNSLASAGYDGIIKMSRLASGGLERHMQSPVSPLFSIAFAPSGEMLFAVGVGDSIIRWIPTNDRIDLFASGHQKIFCTKVSPDGRTLATAGYDRAVRLWDIADLSCREVLRGHTNLVWDLAFSPDSESLASASWDGTVRIWSTRDQPSRASSKEEFPIPLSLSYSPDGKYLVAASSEVVVCEARTLEQLQVLQQSRTTRASFSPDGRRLAATSNEGILQFWDTTDWHGIISHRGLGDLWTLAFSPDGRVLVTGNRAGELKCWDAENGKLLAQPTTTFDLVNSVAFSPDFKTLVVSGRVPQPPRHELQFFDWPGMHLTASLKHPFPAQVRYSADGKFIAATDNFNEGRLLLWKTKPLEMGRNVMGHASLIWNSAFSPDGKTLATASWDGTVRLWHVHTGTELFALKEHKAQCFAVAFSPDGEDLVSSSEGRNLLVWHGWRKPRTAEASRIRTSPEMEFGYTGGFFRKLSLGVRSQWKETKTATDELHFFEQQRSGADNILLKDVKRNVSILLPVKGGMSRLSMDGGKNWRDFCQVQLLPREN